MDSNKNEIPIVIGIKCLIIKRKGMDRGGQNQLKGNSEKLKVMELLFLLKMRKAGGSL